MDLPSTHQSLLWAMGENSLRDEAWAAFDQRYRDVIFNWCQACDEGVDVDRRSDVFGLGAILCEILTGRPPYCGDNALAKAKNADLSEAMTRLHDIRTHPELVQLAKRCLALKVDKRPSDGGQVAAAIAEFVSGVQKQLEEERLARTKQELKAAEERKRRNLRMGLAVAIVVAFLCATAGGVYWNLKQTERKLELTLTANDLQQAEKMLNAGNFVSAKESAYGDMEQ